MKIELRKLQMNVSLSQETPCYSAIVYVDGRPAVDVRNEGRGGADFQRPYDGHSLDKINTDIAAALPKVSMKRHGLPDIPCTLELWCHEQVWEEDAKKLLRRRLKSGVVTVQQGKLISTTWKGVRSIDRKHLDSFAARNPGLQTLNSLPFDEAWDIAKPMLMG